MSHYSLSNLIKNNCANTPHATINFLCFKQAPTLWKHGKHVVEKLPPPYHKTKNFILKTVQIIGGNSVFMPTNDKCFST